MEENLREAACFGDLEALTILLNKGVPVNSQHKINGWSALHWAAKRNNVDCVNALLSRGADVKLRTSKGEFAEHLTTNRSILKTLQLQVQDPNADTSTLSSELKMTAISSSREEKVDSNVVPHYLRHPDLNYKVNLKERQDKHEKHEKHQEKQDQQKLGKKTAETKSKSLLETMPKTKILKVRLAGKEVFDTDFIEMDLPDHLWTFRNLVEIICEEFSIDPKTIVKIRKLPNTKLRRDIEVLRLDDYQEIEVEVADI